MLRQALAAHELELQTLAALVGQPKTERNDGLERTESEIEKLRCPSEVPDTGRSAEVRATAPPLLTQSGPTQCGSGKKSVFSSQASKWGFGEDKVHPIWAGAVDESVCGSFQQLSTMSLSRSRSVLPSTNSFALSEDHIGDLVGGDGCSQHFVWQPSAKGRIAWEIASVFVIGWDLVLTLPLGAFGADMLVSFEIIGRGTTCFWFLDMIYSFFVAYQRPDGLIEMRLPAIARHYLRTWFALDFAVVFIDVLLLVIFGGGMAVDGVRLGKTIRAVRLMRTFRMVRLARLMKLVYLLERVADVMISRAVLTFLNILKLLGGVALVTHFIACGWYAVGTWHGRGKSLGWVSQFDGASKPYLYITAFHWSMAQFTPAPNNVHPTNFEERVFALLALFLGLVLFTSLIGRVTALLAQSRRQAYEQLVEAEKLRELCVRKKVPLALSNRIIRFLTTKRASGDKSVTEDEVTNLKQIPTSMLAELRYSMYSGVIGLAPVLSLMRGAQRALLSDICYTAVKEMRVPRDYELFTFGAKGKHVFFVVHGEFSYDQSSGMSFKASDGIDGRRVVHGAWLSEGTLWTAWRHRGLCGVVSPGSVVTLDAEEFRTVVQHFEPSLHLLRKYAQQFLRRLRIAGGLVDDLWKAFADEDDIVSEIPSPMQGPAAVAPYSETSWLRSGPRKSLAVHICVDEAPGVDTALPTPSPLVHEARV
eukprot:CAMPEP_0176029556 /NCGR_PEP_ID=MMETSP0120_2-20121206/14525_1 /TAXON_ID=160619 /ORGANISM="Kryptoperidinium foliaceum, Strain CCMP 1326" /LENGTH=702 /DNA_ID=CAMNT_0017362783 /DNA_START=63 /DNA_END=2172 /DNA_ORIENTATION=+